MNLPAIAAITIAALAATTIQLAHLADALAAVG